MSTILHVDDQSMHRGERGETLDSLVLVLGTPCPACESKGVVYNPTWRAWNDAYDQVMRITDTGWRRGALAIADADMPREPEEIPCVECNGTGELLTETGKLLLNFVRIHLHL